MNEPKEDHERDVEDVPHREKRLPIVEHLVPQLVRVHQHDRNCQGDQKSWFLVGKDWQESEPGDKAEHGHGVNVDDARLVTPVIGNDLGEVVDGRKEGSDTC